MLTKNAIETLEKRYLLKGESPDDMFRRVAAFVAQDEKWEETFYSAMKHLDFLPNSPTLMNAGTNNPMLSACFVLPIEDSMESIFDAVKNAAIVHKSGGKRTSR